jgi:hypothetical protein
MARRRMKVRVRGYTKKHKGRRIHVHGHDKVIWVNPRQTHRGDRNMKRDRARVALPPGKRRGKKRNYYEYRANRTDLGGSDS